MVLSNISQDKYNETIGGIDKYRGDENGLRNVFSPLKTTIDKFLIDQFADFEGKLVWKKYERMFNFV